MQLTQRELATVLAGLRSIQKLMCPPFLCGDIDDERRSNYIRECFPEQFQDDVPLLPPEIDALCEKLNAPEPSAPQWHVMPDDEAPIPGLFRIRGEANRHVASRLTEDDANRICDRMNVTFPITVGLYVEGGLVQGARCDLSATHVDLFVYDKDNAEQVDEEEEADMEKVLERYEALEYGIY